MAENGNENGSEGNVGKGREPVKTLDLDDLLEPGVVTGKSEAVLNPSPSAERPPANPSQANPSPAKPPPLNRVEMKRMRAIRDLFNVEGQVGKDKPPSRKTAERAGQVAGEVGRIVGATAKRISDAAGLAKKRIVDSIPPFPKLGKYKPQPPPRGAARTARVSESEVLFRVSAALITEAVDLRNPVVPRGGGKVNALKDVAASLDRQANQGRPAPAPVSEPEPEPKGGDSIPIFFSDTPIGGKSPGETAADVVQAPPVQVASPRLTPAQISARRAAERAQVELEKAQIERESSQFKGPLARLAAWFKNVTGG